MYAAIRVDEQDLDPPGRLAWKLASGLSFCGCRPVA
jgi:hypothetical protein